MNILRLKFGEYKALSLFKSSHSLRTGREEVDPRDVVAGIRDRRHPAGVQQVLLGRDRHQQPDRRHRRGHHAPVEASPGHLAGDQKQTEGESAFFIGYTPLWSAQS